MRAARYNLSGPDFAYGRFFFFKFCFQKITSGGSTCEHVYFQNWNGDLMFKDNLNS